MSPLLGRIAMIYANFYAQEPSLRQQMGQTTRQTALPRSTSISGDLETTYTKSNQQICRLARQSATIAMSITNYSSHPSRANQRPRTFLRHARAPFGAPAQASQAQRLFSPACQISCPSVANTLTSASRRARHGLALFCDCHGAL